MHLQCLLVMLNLILVPLAANQTSSTPDITSTMLVYSCDSSKEQFSPLADGLCLNGTTWSEDDKCCIKCINCKLGERNETTASTTDISSTMPVYSCDSSKDQFSPLADGLCLNGTTWSEEDNCCIKCINCRPGQRKETAGCLSQCVPCERDHFSAPRHHSDHVCQRCTNCSAIYRLQDELCFPSNDAICGLCLPGFTDIRTNIFTRHEVCTECMKNSTDETCIIFFRPISQLPTNGSANESFMHIGLHVGDERSLNLEPHLIASLAVACTLLLLMVVSIAAVAIHRHRRNPKWGKDVDIPLNPLSDLRPYNSPSRGILRHPDRRDKPKFSTRASNLPIYSSRQTWEKFRAAHARPPGVGERRDTSLKPRVRIHNDETNDEKEPMNPSSNIPEEDAFETAKMYLP